jgi:LacI family transcriptional regulator
MEPTLLDIAKHAGVHVSTVSRALSGNEAISSATVRKVRRAANRLGYRTNFAARALATGRYQRVAFWSPAMGARLFDTIAHCFHELVAQQDHELIVTGLRPTSDGVSSNMLSLARLDVDGILMYGGELGSMRNAMERISRLKIPIVNMGVQCTGALDYVNIEFYPAATQAMRHLLAGGRRRVVHLLTSSANHEGDDSWRAYRDVLAQAGLAAERILVDDYSRAAARRTVTQYLESNKCPDAIFCANDDLAIGALRGLRDLNISVPDDVAVVGSDGIEDTEYSYPAITTMRQPIEQMCCRAWQYLSQRIDKPDAPQQACTLQAELLIRASSSPRVSNRLTGLANEHTL